MTGPVRAFRGFGHRGGRRLTRMVTGASLVAALVGAAPAASPAAVVRATHISANATPSTVLAGQTLVVSGTARPALPAVGLTALELVAGRWRTVGRAHESASGAYTLSVEAPAKAGSLQLRVVRAATASARAGTSRTIATHVVTSALAVRALAATTVVAGNPIDVNGAVSPKATGTVTLQRLLAGHWVRLATAGLSASHFALAAREPVGTYRLRVLSPVTPHPGSRREPHPHRHGRPCGGDPAAGSAVVASARPDEACTRADPTQPDGSPDPADSAGDRARCSGRDRGPRRDDGHRELDIPVRRRVSDHGLPG